MKYALNTKRIEAVKWMTSNIQEIDSFLEGKYKIKIESDAGWKAGVVPPYAVLIINTHAGEVTVKPGEYIVKDKTIGLTYACSEEEFKKTIERRK